MSEVSKEEYNHPEAFCLMKYVCEGISIAAISGESPLDCNHSEILWNSRDGVTPFGIKCPICNGIMNHVEFRRDQRCEDFVPMPGMRIFRDGTEEEAKEILRKRLINMNGAQYVVDNPEKISELYNNSVNTEYGDFPKGWPMIETISNTLVDTDYSKSELRVLSFINRYGMSTDQMKSALTSVAAQELNRARRRLSRPMPFIPMSSVSSIFFKQDDIRYDNNEFLLNKVKRNYRYSNKSKIRGRL